MLGGRGRELRIDPERAWFVLAAGGIYVARHRCGVYHIFRESIVVLLESIDLEEIIVSAGRCQNHRSIRPLQRWMKKSWRYLHDV